MSKNQPKITDFGCEIMDAVSNGLTANLYDIFRQENRAKNRGKAAENQKRRFQKAWFWVPAFIFECSKTNTGAFTAAFFCKNCHIGSL